MLDPTKQAMGTAMAIAAFFTTTESINDTVKAKIMVVIQAIIFGR